MHSMTLQPVYIGIREQGLARVFRSGPGQLALAMAADFLGEDRKALACYRSLQHAVVAGLPYEGWTLAGAVLARALESCR